MVFWGPHRNSLWQKKFCCNLFQVKPYFAWTKCFPFERGQNFPFDWPASVSKIFSVRGWAEPTIVGRKFTSRIRPMTGIVSYVNFREAISIRIFSFHALH